MKDEIKEILEFDFQSQGERIEINEYERDILKDYITNLEQQVQDLKADYGSKAQIERDLLEQENERLKEIAHKMHLWIFLHSGDEQKVYDELGLTDEENAMLGYSGKFRIGEDKK